MRNRTLRDGVLIKRKNLGSLSLEERQHLTAMDMADCYVNESLCSQYHKLHYVCRKLKSDGKIKDCWFFRGKLFAVDHVNKKSQIDHIVDTYAYTLAETIIGYLK